VSALVGARSVLFAMRLVRSWHDLFIKWRAMYVGVCVRINFGIVVYRFSPRGDGG